ncbi:MAG: lytic transglycosylase domain-containing protein, partial [Pseudomonadota bacterium]|nr:lytic transglycosylase domain-containing protein [Pseudomonadota bacterium]
KRYKSPGPASWMTSAPAGAIGSATAPTPVAGSPASVNANPPASFGTPSSTPASASAKPSYQAPRLVRGQVYSFIKDGVRHYSSRAPKGVSGATAMRTIKYSFLETCYACGSKPGVNFGTLRLNLTAYNNEIASAARAHGVDEAIVRAIIHAESAFNPNALSRVGAQGLMQLMPGTARDVGVSNAFDPAQNIGGGVRYLAMLLKRYNGNLTLAAAGYNAGPGAVDKYKGVPPYSETRRYVERVGVLADRYRGSLAAK